MTILCNRPVPPERAAVHVLIVAVGSYPYLKNGTDKLFEAHAEMGQLSSPPESARQLCEWVKKEIVPYGSELKTIDVLCSGAQNFIDDNGIPTLVEAASVDNIKLAAKRFFTLGNNNPEDTLVFYFAGHGVSSGEVHSLLLEGFGSDVMSPFSDAVDAGAFIDGMRKCKALKQLFLFDACRTVPQTYLVELGEFRGIPLISGASHANLGLSKQVALWSSELGFPAYGRIGAATIFAEAFLLAMLGAASRRDPVTFKWVIETYCLQEGINTIICRLVGANRQFVTPSRMTMGFPLHVIDGEPLVPVNIFCRPEGRGVNVDLVCSPGTLRCTGAPWYVDLPRGSYTVEARETGSNDVLDSQACWAVPPSVLIMLRV